MSAKQSFLRRQLTTGATDLCIGELACYAAAIGVLVLGFWKLGSLALEENELLFGVLLVLCAGLLLVVVGQAAAISRRLSALNDGSRTST